VESAVLSEQEQRSLLRIERRLRAEDHRFTEAFEMFMPDLDLDLPVESELRPAVRLVELARSSLAVAALLLIPMLWLVALVGSGDLATVSRLALLPVSALLLALGFALHPDRRGRRRTRRRTRRGAVSSC
jgi:hypothetical protein